MVDGVTGVSAVKNVVEDGRKEVAQIQHLQMEELIVQKNMDLEIKKVATKKNALWMVDGVTGVSAVKNVVEDGRKEVAQIQHLQMEELIVQKDMDLEIKKVATKKNALSMVGGVTGVSAVKNVVEDGGKEVAQIQNLQMEEQNVQKDMDLEIKRIATKKVALSMGGGVSGHLVLNHVVEVGRREVVQIRSLQMEELIVQKDMALEIKMIATKKNALSMVGGVN